MILTTIKSQMIRVWPNIFLLYVSSIILITVINHPTDRITERYNNNNCQRIITILEIKKNRYLDIPAERFSVDRNLRNSNASNPFVTSKSPIFARLSVNHPLRSTFQHVQARYSKRRNVVPARHERDFALPATNRRSQLWHRSKRFVCENDFHLG